MAVSVRSASPKRSVHWYSWTEFKATFPSLIEELAPYEADGWKAAARISITRRVDGSGVIVMPMRNGARRQTVETSWGPDKPKAVRP